MMKLLSRVVPALTSFALLGSAISSARPQQGLAAMRVASGSVRNTSAAYGDSLFYSLRAGALTRLASFDANAAPPAVYPYFTPFTTLARLPQSTVDLLIQQNDLAVQTTLSLFVDPHIPEA